MREQGGEAVWEDRMEVEGEGGERKRKPGGDAEMGLEEPVDEIEETQGR